MTACTPCSRLARREALKAALAAEMVSLKQLREDLGLDHSVEIDKPNLSPG
jgi:hypothetical protein